jgi:hypothetical protein
MRGVRDSQQAKFNAWFEKRPPTKAALRIEALCGQSKKMADGARLVCDF